MESETSMRVVSVNVGLPREVSWKGKKISTSIFKQPVAGRVAVRRLNIDGDRQADLTVHGGPEKAIYAYPAEHYMFWRQEFPAMELPWGMFGENLTIQGGLFEDTLNIGDRLRIGSASVIVTQPRMPCFKLGIRFGRDDILKRFLNSVFTGFYFAVLEEGEVAVGDPISIIERDKHEVKVSEITRLYTRDRHDIEGLRRVVALEHLAEGWRDYFSERLEKILSKSKIEQ